MRPEEAFQLFRAVKLHFTSNYDYFKYNGRVKVDINKFESRRDKYHFAKLATFENPLMHCVANVLRKPNIWIGDMISSEAKKCYLERIGVIRAIDYRVTTELSRYDSWNHALTITDGDYPPLLNDYKKGDVSPETLIIVNVVNKHQVFEYWSSALNDPVVWPEISKTLLKYEPFLGKDVINRKRWLTSIPL